MLEVFYSGHRERIHDVHVVMRSATNQIAGCRQNALIYGLGDVVFLGQPLWALFMRFSGRPDFKFPDRRFSKRLRRAALFGT